MAITFVNGKMLNSDLERAGVDISVESDLLYLDVTNSRVGVNNNSPAAEFDVTGDLKSTTATVGNIALFTGTINATTGNLILSSTSGNISANNKRIINVGDAVGVTDVVNKQTLTGTIAGEIGVSIQAYDVNIVTVKNNYVAVVPPTVNEDSGDGYEVGSIWVDTATEKVYMLLDPTVAAANWIETTNSFTPSSTDALTNKTINTASNTITVVEADISDLQAYILAGGVTYEQLDTNSDVGTGVGQLAIGNHLHTGLYQPLDSDLSNIAALTGTTGFLRTNGATVWTVDTATYEPADGTILKDADIGVTVQAYDATYVVDADIGVTVQAYDATYLLDADIGVNVQAYSATNALLADITYGQLNTNGDVGTSAGQLAIGNHTHTGVYEPADGTILKDADIGVTVQAYDATYLVDADIGVTVNTFVKNNFVATAAPSAATDDTTLGYVVGSVWIDVTNDKAYTALDVTDGAAVWVETSSGISDVTYETLDTNSDVGTSAGQLAIGNHNHLGVYEPADGTILKDADIGVTLTRCRHRC